MPNTEGPVQLVHQQAHINLLSIAEIELWGGTVPANNALCFTCNNPIVITTLGLTQRNGNIDAEQRWVCNECLISCIECGHLGSMEDLDEDVTQTHLRPFFRRWYDSASWGHDLTGYTGYVCSLCYNAVYRTCLSCARVFYHNDVTDVRQQHQDAAVYMCNQCQRDPEEPVVPIEAISDAETIRRYIEDDARAVRPCAECGFDNPHNFYTGDATVPYLCCDHIAHCGGCNNWGRVATGEVNPPYWMQTDDSAYCQACADDFNSCASCGTYERTDNLVYAEESDDYYCAHHLPDRHTYDDERNRGNNNDGVVIRDYHESRHILHKIGSPWTRSHNRYIGVELEVEQIRNDRTASARKILDSVQTYDTEITADKTRGRLLCAEQDGSLTHGFELVTAPLGLDDQRSLWAHVLTSDNIKGLRSHNTTTCGLHVHISRNKLTQLQIAKIVAFVNSATNYAFIKRLARRYGTHYCIAKNIPLCNGAKNLADDRYEMVNLCNTNTIEFRIFRGTLKLESLLACIEFANALVAYADCSSGAGMDITAARFRQFITQPGMKADTAFLRSYLASVVPPTDTE